ncbi:4058_t:CDS:2 [Ambispora leptoticha]|uniref:4058_t:CDS:1 n=1 Tax=Ambispora leptoticha TaxID=144679 RepID=A0A9N8Z9C2_9GLOM|nr:4058_t:CDS:2 [Ambispora leptoticha]
MSKFQTFVLVTAAIFLALLWTASAQVPCHIPTPGGQINVFTPGAGTYSKTSYQAVDWSTNGSVQHVKVCIGQKGTNGGCDNPCFKLIADNVPFGYGTSPTFQTDFPGSDFFAFVQSDDNLNIWGAGPLFNVAAS